jgi:subtilisin family serine protease
MKKWFSVSLMVLFTVSSAFSTGMIEPNLQDKINSTDEAELIPVLIVMDQQADFNMVYNHVKNMPKTERRSEAISIFKNIAENSQYQLRSILEQSELTGDAKDLRYLWIVNAVGGKLTPRTIESVSSLAGVNRIHLDEERYALNVEPGYQHVPPTDDITWSVEMVNGPDVWNLGYQGNGVLVAIVDTGVNYNHTDLVNRMWDGNPTYPHHGWDFYNNDNDPYDDHIYGGHGSHCAGITAGDGTSGTQTGVAPQAEIMAVKVLNASGNGSEYTTMDGMEFALDNGADIISMSLGWVSSTNPDKNAWRTTTNNLLASGMVCSIAAGNERGYSWYPVPDNIRVPGQNPPPWRHPDQNVDGGLSSVVTVASTNQSDVYSSYSSKGPVTWESISPWFDYPYAGGSQQGYVAPDIAAPGENITSCTNQGNNQYIQMSGTSMATPQIAGIMALLLSKDPTLTPAEIDQVLELTSIPKGSAGKDIDYGAGRVDALRAIQGVAGPGGYNMGLSMTPVNPPIQIPAGGGSFDFNIDVQNNETETISFTFWIMVTLPNGSDYGPVLIANLNTPAGWSTLRQRTQAIPAGAPSGTYTYSAYTGLYPDIIYTQDDFTFSKSTDADGGEFIAGWDNYEADSGDELAASLDYSVDSYSLHSAYPNPFNPVTNIQYDIAEAGNVKLVVFDVNGREIATLADGFMNEGVYSAVFNADNLASGVYFYTLTVNGFTDSKKMILMK